MAALPVRQIVDTLHGAGLTLALTPELALKVTPASALTPELRDLIRTSKDMLIGWLHRNPANDLPALTEDKVSARLAAAPADSDRWCWPHTQAMNTGEIDTFTGRVAAFTDRGLGLAPAEALAEKLVVRDRERDDRRLCIECVHLRGAGFQSCSNWAASGMAQLSSDLVRQLQRCNGFTEHGLGYSQQAFQHWP